MDPKDINFNKFCVYINETCSLENLAFPGVFGVECNKTQRIRDGLYLAWRRSYQVWSAL